MFYIRQNSSPLSTTTLLKQLSTLLTCRQLLRRLKLSLGALYLNNASHATQTRSHPTSAYRLTRFRHARAAAFTVDGGTR